MNKKPNDEIKAERLELLESLFILQNKKIDNLEYLNRALEMQVESMGGALARLYKKSKG